MYQNKLSNYATTISSEADYIRVTYHKTVIVKFNSREIILNSGGWRTATTKRKMNQASEQFNLGFYVYQRDYIWYIEFNDRVIEFEDNITLKRE